MKKVLLSLMFFSTICVANDYQPQVGTSGAQIYKEACVVCHGDNGTGKFGLFFDLTSSTLQADDTKKVIQQGGVMMPAFPNITGEELEVLLTYLNSLRPVLAAKP